MCLNPPGASTMQPPTALSLLTICNLPSNPEPSKKTRQERLNTLREWNKAHPTHLSRLLWAPMPPHSDYEGGAAIDANSGCYPLHWAAGTGFDEAVEFIIEETAHFPDKCGDATDRGGTGTTILFAERSNQRAHHPSTGRAPLHYAARNGHAQTCRILIERYQADPNPKCSRGGVTPLQLSVWQNRLEIVRYLVETIGDEGEGGNPSLERNEFNCGLMHWIGLVPKHRWDGYSVESNDAARDDQPNDNQKGSDGPSCRGDDCDDGSGVLPLANYLHFLGVSYESSRSNCNSQGHSPLHKAAWGGNLALLRYFRDVHGVKDDAPDEMGNYGADLARMRGHDSVHRWLLEECGTDREKSLSALGLDAAATDAEIRRRYGELAKIHHPDKKSHRDRKKDELDGDDSLNIGDEFLAVKEAYEHLIKHGGVGRQRNEKHYDLKLLTRAGEDRRVCSGKHDKGDDDEYFTARILAVISDYHQRGFPISNISKRWNQIWPDNPFPSPDGYVVEFQAICSETKEEKTYQKKVNLLRFLRWKCRGSGVRFRKVGGVMTAFEGTARSEVGA